MFYSKLFRRHLLDMHIEDWDPTFLSEFSPEVYVDNLKKANINLAMVYFQSHTGLCNYPTNSGVMHRAFAKQPDMMRRLVRLCHENGIRVCGYYSLIYNTAEHDRHADWRMVTEDGISRRQSRQEDHELVFANPKTARYGLCCPSNPDYRAFVYEQIDEMLSYFDFDAMFFDMPFWPHTCHCEHCRKAYGKPIPGEMDLELVRFKEKTMGQFIQSVTDHVKACCPNMPVSHNFASAIAATSSSGCADGVLAACDYVGGDLYGDLYNHSFACKFYKNATPNLPFEQMFSRCKPALRMHTLTKSRDEMKTAIASTMAHHGATLVIDAIDPVGTMDGRVYEQVGELFRFQETYEPWFVGTMVEEVGLYYGLGSKLGRGVPTSLTCCANAAKTLARTHIPFGVTGSFHGLTQYKIIAAPMLSRLEDKDNARLIEYVNNGGILYLSGFGNPSLVEHLTENRLLGYSEEKNLYIAPELGFEDLFGGFNAKYPLPFEESAPIVEARTANVIATLTFPYTKPDELRYASIHSDPPGIPSRIPAVTVNSYGAGKVIWSALPIEYMQYQEYRDIFLKLLHMPEHQDYFFTADAPVNVELTAFLMDGTITLNAVVMDEETVSTAVAPFRVSVKGLAKSVKLLPSGENICFKLVDGRTEFITRDLHIFDMYEIT